MSIRVFKFGGAALRHARSIEQVVSIVAQHRQQPLLLVVSAMGKTTNALERVAQLPSSEASHEIQLIRNYHDAILRELAPATAAVHTQVARLFEELERVVQSGIQGDERYDCIVSVGESLSTAIVTHALQREELPARSIDARDYVITDARFREGRVHWAASLERIGALALPLKQEILVTQGFVGSTPDGRTTTLGREGSDYSAAIFAAGLQAQSVTIWKDVPGVMNADPKRLPAALVFDELPFKEAAEMTYYGASVIHPKTIKPLAMRSIPLYVRSFDKPELPGTRIHDCKLPHIPPLVVFKDNQCLVSCHVTDYSFVNEGQIKTIFETLDQHDVKINLMQNSAISFSFCADFHERKIMPVIDSLAQHFEVYYNTGLTLITVKNYNALMFDEYRKKPGVILEQSSRSTLQVLVKN